MSMNSSSSSTLCPPLHAHKCLRRAILNRVFTVVYMAGIIALLYHHLTHACACPRPLLLILLLADLILAFTWITTQPFHFRPIRRQEYLENLETFVREGKVELPEVDIFICTADPHKEPPMGTVNTALSVMAYDYPPEKLSVYVSDDGGSQVTLYAFVEAAKFAREWLPFCRENKVGVRCPEAYFSNISHNNTLPHHQAQAHRLKVLLSRGKDTDTAGESTPNLIYVSREKSKTHHHRFKAGALNTLVRVSATMTNAPIVLTLDCDTYSNDPQTIKRTLCYFLDPVIRPMLAYIQFPQIFRELNKGDIYFSEHKRLFQIHAQGMDGLQGPNYVGTGCFFQRRAFFGPPSSLLEPELVQLRPDNLVNNTDVSSNVLELVYEVAACNYEDQTEWGSKLGFRYGSLVEDFNTGYMMQSEGWRSIFCHPNNPAFLGGSPVTLLDMLGQSERWGIGLLDVFFSKYTTIIYGVRRLGLLMGLSYTHYAIWPLHSVPLSIYAFIPQIALLNGISIFPKVGEAWFYLYIMLYIGASGKDFLDFKLEKGSFKRWWNSQRIWMICGVSSCLFACIEYTLTSLGISVHGFNLTSKIQDDELSKRYDQGKYEFGVTSPTFVPMTAAALLNLVSFGVGLMGIYTRGMEAMEGLILQILVSGFVVLNSWPIYDAMLFRSDMGRVPPKLSLIAAFLVSLLCFSATVFLKTWDA